MFVLKVLLVGLGVWHLRLQQQSIALIADNASTHQTVDMHEPKPRQSRLPYRRHTRERAPSAQPFSGRLRCAPAASSFSTASRPPWLVIEFFVVRVPFYSEITGLLLKRCRESIKVMHEVFMLQYGPLIAVYIPRYKTIKRY